MCGLDTWLPLKVQSTDLDETVAVQKALVVELSPVSSGEDKILKGRTERHRFPCIRDVLPVCMVSVLVIHSMLCYGVHTRIDVD